MPWRIVERKLGRAGPPKQREKRQREWDRKYGSEGWMIGYSIDGEFRSQEEALDCIYYESYVAHFKEHPSDLAELVATAKVLKNPHAIGTGGVDLQVPAISRYLKEHNLELEGCEAVDIGSFNNKRSHKLSIRLSPLHIKVVGNPKMTLEKFWQEKKCLAVWET